jgi:pimeloyl-ACP methyl ester carboxylesterase
VKRSCRYKRRTTGFLIVALIVFFQLGRSFVLPVEHKLRHDFHQAVQRWFPDAVQDLSNRQGISPVEGTFAPADHPARNPVILVHGLDDPGIIWDDLIPILQENQFPVLVLSYPNDQAIEASSAFFFEQMQMLAQKNPVTVSIVTHSMGGLVARDMLTRPDLDYLRAAAEKKVPAVDRLILVGPPNRGTQMARFRILTEAKDQIYHLFFTQAHWLHCLLDGTGAAGVDLIPGSCFLIRLNQRALPREVKIQIIAGMIFPGPEDAHLKNILGDGLVSVNTARLQQVPLIRVAGNHFTMIRNLTRTSQRIPPAIPVVLNMLCQ